MKGNHKYDFPVGSRFGSLTIILSHPKNSIRRYRKIQCLCDCGREHWVIPGRLAKGLTTRCMKCANPKWWSDEESHVRKQYINYRGGAARRGYDHQLTLDEFRDIYLSDCFYCGKSPAKGIDRWDNSVGYILKNCVPCCKHCNLAKRDMPADEFLAWVARIAAKQGFSL